MAWKAEVTIPSGNQYHVIREVLSLDLGLLEYNNVSLEDIEHNLHESAQAFQLLVPSWGDTENERLSLHG